MQVVCIDDDPMILRLVITALQRTIGVEAQGFTDSSEALNVLRGGEPPALIILDAMMPGLDGFALCRTLRETEGFETVPIVFLTAGGPAHLAQAMELGATAALPKPFQPNQLVREIATILNVA